MTTLYEKGHLRTAGKEYMTQHQDRIEFMRDSILGRVVQTELLLRASMISVAPYTATLPFKKETLNKYLG